MQPIDLRSDTVTRPSPEMKEYMMSVEVGDDVFGEDPTINRLQEKVAGLLGKEVALFVPSGTQANQICINSHTQPGNEVICDYNSHIFNYESAAGALLSGVQLHPLPGYKGHPRLEQIKPVIRPGDHHFPQTKLICLENTHNRAGGTIFPLDEIERISEFAREKNLKMHLDGARLWNAAIATGIELKEYAKYFDSVSLCFSKGLGAPVGSIIVGQREFINQAHYYRKVYGGGMRQAGIIGGACEYALDNNYRRLAEDHEHARRLAATLSTFSVVDIDLTTVQTNIIIFNISQTGKSSFDICNILKEEGLLSIPVNPVRIRFVTHLDISAEDILRAESILKKVLE